MDQMKERMHPEDEVKYLKGKLAHAHRIMKVADAIAMGAFHFVTPIHPHQREFINDTIRLRTSIKSYMEEWKRDRESSPDFWIENPARNKKADS